MLKEILEFLKLSGGMDKRDTSTPGWRGSGTRMRKARTPFGSDRQAREVRDNYHREEFSDVGRRNARFAEMKARHPGTVKYSTVEGRKSVWVVAWPVREE